MLDHASGVFLVGVGGAGMGGVAALLKREFASVRGSDARHSPQLDRLHEQGVECFVGHQKGRIRPGEVLVVTDAIALEDSPEVQDARELGCPVLRRSQALGWLLRSKKTVAFAGSHGKTTTTAMAGLALEAAGFDPTVVLGAVVPAWGDSVRIGRSEWAVVEACEAYDSLRDFDPYVAVLLNLEPDHLDFHGSWEGMRDRMVAFLSRVPDEGSVLLVGQDEGSQEVLACLPRAAKQVQQWAFGPLFMPGEHLRWDAAAAWAACDAIGAASPEARRAIESFCGVERRLELIHDGEVTVYDDYAHHPTEVLASIASIRQRHPGRRLWVVFQPHLYTRTRDLCQEFAEALDLADEAVVTDIYPAREDPIPGVSALRIVESMRRTAEYVPSRHLLARRVAPRLKLGDVVVGMGAGNIQQFAPALVRDLSRKGRLRVAVLAGGDSAEREVSLHSGRAVFAALQRLGYEATLLDPTELLLGGASLEALTGPNRPDLCFLAAHGGSAESGAYQGLLECLHLPYTGSGILASALALDKHRAKQAMADAGLPVPAGVLLTDGAYAGLPDPPLVVKPNRQGSTVGLSFVETPEELPPALERARPYGEVLVEEWVRGVEISVPVLGGQAMLPVEIVPASGRYDFASKYEPGATDEICPARISERESQLAAEYALTAHQALGCRGLTRTDMIVAEGRIVCLEVNTLPGMTSTSLVPKSASTAGICFDQLVGAIVREALELHGP